MVVYIPEEDVRSGGDHADHLVLAQLLQQAGQAHQGLQHRTQ